MTTYDAAIKGILATKANQTPAENKAAIARNVASYDLAHKHKLATEARGPVNQAVKSKLIK